MDVMPYIVLVWEIMQKVYGDLEEVIQVHPPKQTWFTGLNGGPLESRRFLLETIISRFHVNYWGCNSKYFKSNPCPGIPKTIIF